MDNAEDTLIDQEKTAETTSYPELTQIESFEVKHNHFQFSSPPTNITKVPLIFNLLGRRCRDQSSKE